MQYSFTCPAEGCDFEVIVDAESDDEAVEIILAIGRDHGKKEHPDQPSMTEEEMKEMVRAGMKKR